MNILNIIREQLSPEILGQISKSVGESPEGTQSALQQALPALLGSAAAQASSPGGATGLLEMLKQKAPQGGWSDTLSGLLGSAGGGSGSSFVSSLLGPKMNLVRDFIAGHSGIRPESATSLMSAGGQILMGILGKQVMARGLGASGLGQLLSSQIPHLQGLVPPEMANMLGIGNYLGMSKHAVSDAASQAAPVMEHARSTGGASALRWAIPLAVVLGAILLIYQHNRRGNVGGTADETSGALGTGAGTNVSTLGVNGQAFTDRMKAAIATGDGTPVALQGVDFDSSGNLSGDAETRLLQLGKLINESPSMQVSITAYGNGVEEATSRAKAIQAALVKGGLAPERISTQPEVGQGSPKARFAK
jgi:hypothetical protein